MCTNWKILTKIILHFNQLHVVGNLYQTSDIPMKENLLTPEPGDVLLKSSVSNGAGVNVSLLRTEGQVGEDAKAEVGVGVILRLADVLLAHRLAVPRPGDIHRRRVEVGH